MNYGESESEAKQRSGLRGTPYEGPAATEAYTQGRTLSTLADKFTSSPSAMMDYGRAMIPGGKYGLGANADPAVEALGKYQFGLDSGQGGVRGQLSPENMSAVISSSLQNMLPFLIPQMQATQFAQFQAPQSLMQTAKTSADYWNRALGAQSDQSMSGFQFGFNPNETLTKAALA